VPHIENLAQTAPAYRRLERFFNDVKLNEVEAAQLVMQALSLGRKPRRTRRWIVQPAIQQNGFESAGARQSL
jgi:hypothetical protein